MFMWATFCDDIRQEAGNKLSYMGIYGTNLVVPAFPTLLPKFCCIFNLRVAAASAPRSVTFKLFRDDEVIFETGAAREPPLGMPPDIPAGHFLLISTAAQIVSFEISGSATLRAVADVDGRELGGGTLELQSASANAGQGRA